MATSMESRPGLLERCPNRRKFAQAHWKFAQATVEIRTKSRKFAQIIWKSDQMWAGFLATPVGNPPALGRVPPFPPFLGGPLCPTAHRRRRHTDGGLLRASLDATLPARHARFAGRRGGLRCARRFFARRHEDDTKPRVSRRDDRRENGFSALSVARTIWETAT